MEIQELKKTANEIRKTVLEMVHQAGSGHPGGSLSAAEIVTALYFQVMNIDPKNPQMKDRDRFVLSKGHCAPVLYAALGHRGFFPVEKTMSLRKLGSPFQGHPDMHKVPGVEMSTGSLGQGLSISVGMALAGKMDKSPGRIYTLTGDGELDEGMIWEAAMAAGHYKLDNLTAMVDWNGLQIDGWNKDIMTVEPIEDKFATFGWHVLSAEGNSMEDILDKLEKARSLKGKPTVIVAKTCKGCGVSYMEDMVGWHGKAPNEEQLALALEELGGKQE